MTRQYVLVIRRMAPDNFVTWNQNGSSPPRRRVMTRLLPRGSGPRPRLHPGRSDLGDPDPALAHRELVRAQAPCSLDGDDEAIIGLIVQPPTPLRAIRLHGGP